MGREPKAGATWNVVYDSSDSQVLSLVVTPDGISYAGTGPSGQVVNLTDPKHPASRPDPKVQYIWDLACDPQGNLLAATGPNGQLWKRSTDGQWSLLYDSKSTHLLCLAVGPDGSIYAGSDGEGLDLPGLARRQGDDHLRRPPVGDPNVALGRRRRTLCRHGGGSRRWKHGPQLDVPGTGRHAQLLDGPPSDRDGGVLPTGRSDDDVEGRDSPDPPGAPAQPRPARAGRPGRLGRSQADHARATTPFIVSTPTEFRARC